MEALPSGGSSTPGPDPAFDFTFSGGGILAFGTLDAYSNGDGTFTATTGSVTVIGGSVGTPISLYANPAPPGEVISPSGYFIYDDQLLPGQNPSITNGGLLFRDSSGFEVNIFSNGPGPGTYQYYENTGVNTYGNFTLTAVPEPATFVMGGTALLAGLGYTWIRRRKVAIA